MSCGTGALMVTWDISVPADNYTTIISRGVGQPLHCNSTGMQCTAEGLICGSSYVVNVFSVTGTCFSVPSTDVTVHTCEKHRCITCISEGSTSVILLDKVSNWFVFLSLLVPCPPTNVTAVHACAPNPVPVTWVASQGAKYYNAVAVSGGGHISECTTNETSCRLTGLQCGAVYTIGVSPADDDCAGQQSDTVSLNTGKTTRKSTRIIWLQGTDVYLLNTHLYSAFFSTLSTYCHI